MDTPNITEWNLRIVEGVREYRDVQYVTTDSGLSVMRSVTKQQYEASFHSGSSVLPLLRRG